MQTLLRELRSIIEHERAVYGDVLPLDDASSSGDASPSDTDASDTSVSGTSHDDAAPSEAMPVDVDDDSPVKGLGTSTEDTDTPDPTDSPDESASFDVGPSSGAGERTPEATEPTGTDTDDAHAGEPDSTRREDSQSASPPSMASDDDPAAAPETTSDASEDGPSDPSAEDSPAGDSSGVESSAEAPASAGTAHAADSGAEHNDEPDDGSAAPREPNLFSAAGVEPKSGESSSEEGASAAEDEASLKATAERTPAEDVAADETADSGANASTEPSAESSADSTSGDGRSQESSQEPGADEPPTDETTTQDTESEDAAPEGAPVEADSSPDSDASSDAPSPDPSESTDPMRNRDLFGNEVNPAEDPSLPPWERIGSLVPDDAPYKDAETLEEVEEYLANNVLVPIDEDRENPVFGVGDPESDLVIIGEAPGRDEDKKGEPFVGRAGTLLDKILDAINFKREDVYITNILKSRPPRNRDPHAEEVEAHLPILYKQLAIIRPKIILCVGKVAGNTMLDRSSSLSSLRGTEHDFYGTPLMVTYHPAALLRNPQWKRPTWEDVKLLRTRYDQLTEDEE